jgi:hypothetical protein
MKRYIKIGLFVVLFFAVAGVVIGLYLFNLKHADLAKAKPDFIITASALQKEFEVNEATASAKYINKIIEVTGSIASVSKADSSNLNVSLKTGSDISSVICNCRAITDPSKLKTGDEITIRGECSGFLMDVLLKECAIVPKRK